MMPKFSTLALVTLTLVPVLALHAESEKSIVVMETLPGEGVWVSPLPKELRNKVEPLRVTVWFDKQLLGDGEGYQRRARVMQALKIQSKKSRAAAQGELRRMPFR